MANAHAQHFEELRQPQIADEQQDLLGQVGFLRVYVYDVDGRATRDASSAEISGAAEPGSKTWFAQRQGGRRAAQGSLAPARVPMARIGPLTTESATLTATFARLEAELAVPTRAAAAT